MRDVVTLRDALRNLPRAKNHRPGEPVALTDVYTVQAHRAALDLERPLVVGNRGMGKSFWAHALLDEKIRAMAAEKFRFPVLRSTKVVFGFNGSERMDEIAPPPAVLEESARNHAAVDLWRAVLIRAVAPQVLAEVLPERFSDLVSWVASDRERCALILTQADDTLHRAGQHLLVLFDALDRIAEDWPRTKERLQALLQLALHTQSFRSLRLKLFLRSDQFADQQLFAFADASKIRNLKVDLIWPESDLYEFLFQRLRLNPSFQKLEATIGPDRPERLVNALAGEFMGAGPKRGRVFTWLPTHLSDAHGQISPRTFLTVWREAAMHTSAGASTAVDHLGIQEGVRQASADRLRELEDDYPWVRAALKPLGGEFVPMDLGALERLWRVANTEDDVKRISQSTGRLVHLPPSDAPMTWLLAALQAIGVMEVRTNGKINVPDIYRVEARIKRRGGVRPPRKGR